jgi:hypothetical protein
MLRAQSPRRPDTEAASLSGSVIRIDPMTGAPAPGNPLAASADPIRRNVIAYGLRNPFRFTFRPGTRELWIGDVGQNSTEEINVVADTTDGVVENFGWPCFEGSGRMSGMDNANLDQCESLYTAGTAIPPAFEYRHDQAVIAGEACDTGSSAVSAMAFSQATSYPAKYRSGLFWGDYSRSCMWFAPLDAQGRPDFSKRETFATKDGTFRPVHLTTGPGGDLVVTDIAAGLVRRISYTAGNQAPTAAVTASPSSGSAPLTVTLDARGSSDPDGGTLQFSWDLDGDGTFGDATTATVTRTYQAPGDVTVRVRVTDAQGASDTASVTVRVGNDAPTALITEPADGALWQVGDVVRLSGVGEDAQDGVLPASAYAWTVVLKHCPSNCHDHVLGEWSGVRQVDVVAPDHEYPSRLEATLTVQDSQGLTSSVTRRLDPRTADLALRTEPAGLALVTGFESTTTPFDQRVIAGSVNSVAAPEVQALNGRRYRFVSWSDGGEASHLVVAPPDGLTLTATYVDDGPADGDTTPPSAPDPVLGSAEAGRVTLVWGASSDDTGVARYRVHRSATSGFTPSGSTGVGTTEDLTWSQDVTPGTYYYRVVAEDAAGNRSAPSREVTVVVAQDDVPPATPAAVSAVAAGNDVFLAWDDVPDDGPVTYEVHRGESADFPVGAGTRVGTSSVSRWQDTVVPQGTWHYRVAARDAAGNLSAPSTARRVTVLSVQGRAVVRDEFARDVTGGWGAAPLGGSWSVSRAASFGVAAGAGRVTNESAGSDRAAWLAASDVRDVDLVVAFTADTRVLSGNGQTVKALVRRQAAYHEYRASALLRGDGRLDLGLRRQLPGATETGPTVAIDGGFTRGTRYFLRFAATGANPTTLRAKVWPAATSEPTDWAITWSDSAASLQVAGDVGVASYVSGAATGTPVTSAVDLVAAADAGTPDTTAPTAPGTPTATVDGDGVAVTWAAATDAVGVTAYHVYRGAAAGFGLAEGELRGTVDGSTRAFVDRPVSPGTYHYRVVAVDAAGNASLPSASAQVVVPGAGGEEAVTILPTADTWVNAASPTATAGSSWVLRGKGGSGAQESYLRFQLPAAPTGKTLVGARLQLTMSSNAWAGSSAGYDIRHVTSTTWSESTTNWNTRPALSSTTLGVVPAGTVPGQVVQVPLDAAFLAPRLGALVSMALTGSSSDNVELHSRNAPASGPVLVLDFR